MLCNITNLWDGWLNLACRCAAANLSKSCNREQDDVLDAHHGRRRTSYWSKVMKRNELQRVVVKRDKPVDY